MKSFRIAAVVGIVAVLVGIGLLFIPSDEVSSRQFLAGTGL